MPSTQSRKIILVIWFISWTKTRKPHSCPGPGTIITFCSEKHNTLDFPYLFLFSLIFSLFFICKCLSWQTDKSCVQDMNAYPLLETTKMFYLTHWQSATTITWDFFHYRFLLSCFSSSQVFPSSMNEAFLPARVLLNSASQQQKKIYKKKEKNKEKKKSY